MQFPNDSPLLTNKNSHSFFFMCDCLQTPTATPTATPTYPPCPYGDQGNHPDNGGYGNCGSTLAHGSTCTPSCNADYQLTSAQWTVYPSSVQSFTDASCNMLRSPSLVYGACKSTNNNLATFSPVQGRILNLES